jgi:3-deoxy-7-phosphoheptulonate synthase/3,4-dideoxy-4-amino-D-arabino-heptulosonate 7-phosphate synthase
VITIAEARLADALARPADQQPAWPDAARLRRVRRELARRPPLVRAAEVDRLAERLARVAAGAAFLLQGGDCAETFADGPGHVAGNLRALLDAAAVLRASGGLPVVAVGRVAGQYAKPRSRPTDADGLPAYRGDIVNAHAADPAGRVPDPDRLLAAYRSAGRALRVVRATARAAGTELYTSHEALLLDYERPLVRAHGPDRRPYGLSAHFLWIGERTRRPDGAHVRLAELLANPVGVKIGPGVTPAEAVALAGRLDPHREPGRLTFVSRMGADRVRDVLPPVVAAVTAAGHPVVWQCDPMHGNTHLSPAGVKTRAFDRIAAEIDGFFAVHRELGTHPGGVHLELTGDDVTECLGGPQGLTDADLGRRYETACDPRLNARQTRELAGHVAALLAARVPASSPVVAPV